MIDMKNYIRILTIITALMFGAANGAWALTNDDIEIEVKPSASTGNISKSISGQEVTLTVTPATGYFIRASDIVVEKLVDPGKANAPKRRTPDFTDVITGKMYSGSGRADEDIISSVKYPESAEYVFTVPADYDGAYVTATFHLLSEGEIIRITESTDLGETPDMTKHYVLVDDVSASVLENFYSETAFTGTFDGNGYTITGLTHPLFKIVDGGVVKNVTLKNVAINSSEDYVGAIAGIAQGYSRIYNCGILPNDATFPEGTHPTVITTGNCAGGIVGKLDGDSRVINCYSYADVSASTTAAGIVGQNTFASTAEVSGGKYTKLKTAVVNCMFYGNITGGTNQYGVYGGSLITNAAATGISSYNYYRSGSKFTAANGHPNINGGANVVGNPTAYNCSFPADER